MKSALFLVFLSFTGQLLAPALDAQMQKYRPVLAREVTWNRGSFVGEQASGGSYLLVRPPTFPVGESVSSNIEVLRSLSAGAAFAQWVRYVAPRGQWDYKARFGGGWRQWQDAGNFNYGATGRDLLSRLFPSMKEDQMTAVLLHGGGAVQILSNLSRGASACGAGDFCDNPEDELMVRLGAEWSRESELREWLSAPASSESAVFRVQSVLGDLEASYELPALDLIRGAELRERDSRRGDPVEDSRLLSSPIEVDENDESEREAPTDDQESEAEPTSETEPIGPFLMGNWTTASPVSDESAGTEARDPGLP